MCKVLLIYPLSGDLSKDFDPIGLGYIASVLHANGINAEIRNLSRNIMEKNVLVKDILREKIPLLGVSVINDTAKQALSFVKELRDNKYTGHVCFGGHFPTFYDYDILSKVIVDSVIRYEGEESFLKLAKSILMKKDWHQIDNLSFMQDGIIRRNRISKCPILDDLPNPYRPHLSIANGKSYTAYISSSRGCFGNCIYCSVQSFYKAENAPKWRSRSPYSIVTEIETLWKKYGVINYIFIDDDFIPPSKEGRERAFAIANELIEKKLPIVFSITCNVRVVEINLFRLLKDAGLRMVSLGIESSDCETLKKMQKPITVDQSKNAIKILNDLNIGIDFGMIYFSPFTTLSTLRSDLKLVSTFGSYKPNNLPINRMKLRRGTTGYKIMKLKGFRENELGEINWPFKSNQVLRVYNIFIKVFICNTKAINRINCIVSDTNSWLTSSTYNIADKIDLVQNIYKRIRSIILYVANDIIDNVEAFNNVDAKIILYYSKIISDNLTQIENSYKSRAQ